MAANIVMAQNYGITFGDLEVTAENAADIFGDGLASYDLEQNQLTLQEGFDYHQSKDFVTISTGRDFHIRLEGNAEMAVCVDCGDNLFIEASDAYTLEITSNISGSALKCPNLTVENNVSLELLSRNSQDGMYALNCADALTVNYASIRAEVTTARLAVAVQQLVLNESYLQKPAGGIVNPVEGGICYGDGSPAKLVRIMPDVTNLEENNVPTQNARTQKLFENGRIVIVKDGRKFNLAGQEVH